VTINYPSIASPTYSSPAMSMAGTASGNRSVTQVRWSTDRGASGVASGTGAWVIPSITLFNGLNVVTVTAVDSAGNQGSVSMTVTLR
jgi:hypothetical protein